MMESARRAVLCLLLSLLWLSALFGLSQTIEGGQSLILAAIMVPFLPGFWVAMWVYGGWAAIHGTEGLLLGGAVNALLYWVLFYEAWVVIDRRRRHSK